MRPTTHSFSSFPGMAIRNGSAACFSYFSRPSTSSFSVARTGDRAPLGEEARVQLAGEFAVRGEELEGESLAQRLVLDLVDLGHSAPPEETNDAV